MANRPPSSSTTAAAAAAAAEARLAAVGFCGADDSVNPRLLKMISDNYPLVEWGVLFRPDREGQPRYATEGWVSRLSRTVLHDECEYDDDDVVDEDIVDEDDDKGGRMMNDTTWTRTTSTTTRGRQRTSVRLAAHLCGSHVNDLLDSSMDGECAYRIDAFLRKLTKWGFGRVQVNATSINGVDTGRLFESSSSYSSSYSSSSGGEGTGSTDGTSSSSSAAAISFLRTTEAHPDLMFIVQRNDETEPLWSALLPLLERRRPSDGGNNVVFLHDESKGTGRSVPGGLWPTDGRFVCSSSNDDDDATTTRSEVGYAGGIRPTNVVSVVESASIACMASGGERFWIDMESGVRTTVLRKPDVDDRDGTTTTNMVEEDIFDISKCYDCIDRLCEAGWISHPTGTAMTREK